MSRRPPPTVVRGRKRKESSGALVVIVACGLMAAAAAGSLYWWRVAGPGGAVAIPVAAPAAGLSIVASAPPAADPVAAAVAANALLTPEAARALAEAWRSRGLATDDLGETALLMALKGFAGVPPAQAEGLRSSFEKLYAALPPADRATAERLLGQIREGRADSGDLARTVALMDTGARQMDEASRSRFREQYSGAVVMAVAMRDESDRIAAAGPPVYVAEAPVPASEPVVRPAAPRSSSEMITAPGNSASVGGGPSASTRESSGGDGRGEAYWRGRAAQLRGDVERAQAAVTASETALRGEILRDNPRDCNLPPGLTMEQIKRWKCYVGSAVPAARAKVEQAQANLERAKRALDGLDEEARRAGALPGWLR